MKRTLPVILLYVLTLNANAQPADQLSADQMSADSLMAPYRNSADILLASSGKLMLGGYGEVHYNQPLSPGIRNNGTLDVHRMVMLLGYSFNSKTQFISEIEFEHVGEVFVEQAFLQYKFRPFLNFRAGLMLIPMGIVNEYHEPVTFNGVERPSIDPRIAPTTWREIGIGVTGTLLRASLKYQLSVVNGFSGYDGEAQLEGGNGFRNGRQKGAESYISAPNLTGKIEYFGIRGLNIGLSGYWGNTQSTLYKGVDKNDGAAMSRADSSVVGIIMSGLDARYQYKGLELRGQFYYTTIFNTAAYNEFTTAEEIPNDLGSAMLGFYVEAGYNILRLIPQSRMELIAFGRFEKCNTHFATAGGLEANSLYNNNIITGGLTLKLARGAVVKTDMQFLRTGASQEFTRIFNAGIGIMF